MNVECLSVGILVADYLCAPIDHVPNSGELVMTDRLKLDVGGCASNTATDLAWLGVRVGVVGCVGEDLFGKFLLDRLGREGVDTSDVKQLAGTDTSGTMIINVAGEDRRFIGAPGANAALHVADIPRERMLSAKVLYVGGYLFTPGLDPEELAALFRQARSGGVTTVLDMVLPDQRDHWPALECVLAETDVFLPNEDEAAAITGAGDPLAQAGRLRAAGVRTVVITRGDQGTVLVGEHVRLRAGVYPAEYVGGTGAGDAFSAGYIAGLLAGGDARRCLEWGSALGASCVRAIGATESVFSRAEAETFIRDNTLRIEEF